MAIKWALPDFPPFLQMGSRFLGAGLLMAAGLKWLWRAPLPTARQWLEAGIIGTLLLAGGGGGTAYAEQTVSSSLIATFIAVEPALMVCIYALFGRRLSVTECLATVLGLIGVALLIRGDGFAAAPFGLAAISIAALSWSIGSALATEVFESSAGPMGIAAQMMVAGAVLFVLALIRGERVVWPPSLASSLAWVYLVIFSSILAFGAFFFLLTRVRTGVAMSYTFINPLVAVALGVAFDGEPWSPREACACLIIIGSVVLLLWAPQRGDAHGPEHRTPRR